MRNRERKNMTATQEICLYVTILGLLSPFVAYALATVNIFFTLLESGNIKYIYRGDTLRRIIADVKGKMLKGHILVPLTDGEVEPKESWEKRFGIYWIGIPPFASIKSFKIKPRRAKEELAGKPITEWIEEKPEITADSLRGVFPRPFLLEKVELEDRQIVDLIVVGKFAVVDAYTPVVELKGAFFELAGSILRGAVNDILEKFTMDGFKDKNKGEGGILEVLTKIPVSDDPSDPIGAFNRALQKRTGLHLVGATIPEWNPSDPTVRDAMNLRFKAEKQAEATQVEAAAYALQVQTKTAADAKRIADLGSAQKLQIEAVVKAMTSTGAEKGEILKAVARLLEMEAAASETSSITTLVQQGGAQPVISVGGNRP